MDERTLRNSNPVTADAGTRADAPAGGEAQRRENASRPLPDDVIAIVPVRNVVLFPGAVIPLTVGRERSRAAAQEAARLQRPLGVLLQSKPEAEEPGPDDLHWVGTTATVLRYITAPDGSHHAICSGVKRFRVLQFLDGYPFLAARVQPIDDPEAVDADIEGRAHNLRERALEILQLLPQVPEEMAAALNAVEGPSRLADFIAGLMDVGVEEKQALLESFDLKARLDKLLDLLSHRIEVLKVSREIDEKTRESIGDANRKHLLREQMRAIQKELGEGEEGAAELAELDKAIAAAKMPEEVEKQARKELKRLEHMPEAAGEYSMVRTYLEWLIELPWAADPGPAIDVAEARRVLDADHYGLEKVKRRILEFLAVRKLNPSGKSPILCFVGPPGVGKTSLGQSIAKATGRKFVRISLGGVHDEAEIRGHRRTYIGALPGNIIQTLRRVWTRNPVFTMDEIDKLGSDFRGDPAAALLEVLDPEQNNAFTDHYLDVPYDLSKVMFITTANILDPVPPALRDRMEVIELQGYTEEEKVHIAFQYLIPRQIEENGITAEQIDFPEAAIRSIIRHYTREAGVRNLERTVGTICRKQARRIAEGKNDKLVVTDAVIQEFLGGIKIRSEGEIAERTKRAGVVVGLAWTPSGGDILFVEASQMKGKGGFTITGQIQDVMRESMQAGLSWVRSNAKLIGIDEEFFEKHDIHIHVPAGAIPKDGPSAGVTIVTALVSLLTGKQVRPLLAMTGEITLSGNVLPIGGVKEKFLAAKRAGVRDVVFPSDNKMNVEEDLLPEQLQDVNV